MAHTTSYVPKEFSMPSFSLGFTDLSQEETLTQEGQPGSQKGKSPETPILIKELEGLVGKITNSGVKAALDFGESKSAPVEKQLAGQIFEKEQPNVGEMKEKYYIWATRVMTYRDGTTNEYDPVCTLNIQQPLLMSKVHFASLKASTYIEAEIVNAMCLILNQQNIKKFEEEIYCLSLNIAIRCINMAIGNHAGGEFLQPK
ncbi:hypothetical protein Ahy_B04g069932 [Arachis hypogaea]|uniref:Uncharacterized protein n=1 Tax=Arachis hypogaea TaxID=3818 RepID=A0A444ZDY8_ARAHY|nr:hypothetical protein Ahy_B04g069932 [Arachis hypogaea]